MSTAVWDCILSEVPFTGAPKKVIGRTSLVLNGHGPRVPVRINYWAVAEWPEHESIWIPAATDPDSSLYGEDVVILSHKQAHEWAMLLDLSNVAVQVALACHESGHALVDRFYPLRESNDLATRVGDYANEDIAWEVGRKLFEALPYEVQKLCPASAWEQVRAFALGAYWAAASSSVASEIRLPGELRRTIVESCSMLWTSGITVG